MSGKVKLLDALQATRDETLGYYALPEEDLNKLYGPGKWSVRFVLHHLADAETVLYERIRRTLAEPRPVVWAFDADDWARELDYEARPLGMSRALFQATRA